MKLPVSFHLLPVRPLALYENSHGDGDRVGAGGGDAHQYGGVGVDILDGTKVYRVFVAVVDNSGTRTRVIERI